jgi:hypothetical protein
MKHAKSQHDVDPDPLASLVQIPETQTPKSVSRLDSEKSPDQHIASEAQPNTYSSPGNDNAPPDKSVALQHFMVGLNQLSALKQNLMTLVQTLQVLEV